MTIKEALANLEDQVKSVTITYKGEIFTIDDASKAVLYKAVAQFNRDHYDDRLFAEYYKDNIVIVYKVNSL